MQTFVTDSDPWIVAQHLDNRRLNKQITEALQIIRSNLDAGNGWRSHPAVQMWHDHEHCLAAYTKYMIREWWSRGYDSHHKSDIQVDWFLINLPDTGWPSWWGDLEMIRTHQSNLIRKDPEYYEDLFPGVPDDLPYFWPTQQLI